MDTLRTATLFNNVLLIIFSSLFARWYNSRLAMKSSPLLVSNTVYWREWTWKIVHLFEELFFFFTQSKITTKRVNALFTFSTLFNFLNSGRILFRNHEGIEKVNFLFIMEADLRKMQSSFYFLLSFRIFSRWIFNILWSSNFHDPNFFFFFSFSDRNHFHVRWSKSLPVSRGWKSLKYRRKSSVVWFWFIALYFTFCFW